MLPAVQCASENSVNLAEQNMHLATLFSFYFFNCTYSMQKETKHYKKKLSKLSNTMELHFIPHYYDFTSIK